MSRPLPTATTMDSPLHTPPRRKRGAKVSLGRRYAIARDVALAIFPGNSRVPTGIPGPHTERYCVSAEHPTKLRENCKIQMDDTEELDLSNNVSAASYSTSAAAPRTVEDVSCYGRCTAISGPTDFVFRPFAPVG